MQSRPDNSAAPTGDAREPHAFSAADDEMARLHEISTRLFATTGLQPLLEEIVEGTIALLDADFGNIHLYDSERSSLTIVAQRGFTPAFVDACNRKPEGLASCGAAVKRRARVIVEDILTDPLFGSHVGSVAAVGYRAVQSTPLFSHAGAVLGTISTHFRRPHCPSPGTLRVLDLYAMQAAAMIERLQTEAALVASEDRLRSLITERSRAASETTALKNALAEELAAMTRLHAFSTRLLAETDLQHLLEEVLDAIVALLSADLGILQLYNSATRTLDIVVYRGFETDFVARFRSVGADSSTASARALCEQQRVIIEDVDTDPLFGQYRDAALAAGFRAVQSTPMFSRGSQPLGVISTYSRRPHRPSDDLLRMTDLYAGQAAEMIESKQAERALRTYQRELQELTTRLIEAQEIQSKHLARELHDVFSQRLAAIGMELARLADTPLPSGATLRAPLLALTAQVGVLAKDIHGIARQMHPAILDDLGLPAAIRSECLAFAAQYEIPAEFTSDSIPYAIPEDVALCFYRIAQESLRNIAKHAGASQVSVRLWARPRELVLAIGDVGVGIDAESIRGKRGLGLVSMEERLRMVGGTLSIRSQQGAGTQVTAVVPIAS